MRLTINFWKLNNPKNKDLYNNDLIKSGAYVLNCFEDTERLAIRVEVENLGKFRDKFKMTESFNFSSMP